MGTCSRGRGFVSSQNAFRAVPAVFAVPAVLAVLCC